MCIYIYIFVDYDLSLLLMIIHGPGPAPGHVRGPRGRPSEGPGGGASDEGPSERTQYMARARPINNNK